ncbi:MAG TPA: gliding motility protein GldC [Bacteroidia bacterium]|nr:gliding motility protein GldC [Bacteroidia bacterium]
MKKSDIRFTVTLDENQIPERIQWMAEDSGMQGEKECNSVLISIWDPKDKSTLRIDLWTQKMMVEEMQHLFYETFRSMADTYLRATNDDKAAAEITAFAEKFGKTNGVLK